MSYRESGLSGTGVRILLSIPFLAAGIYLIRLQCSLSMLGLLPVLIGVLLLISPALSFLTKPIASIFYPKKGKQEVNLMFSIPESRIMEGKHDEALALLKEMIPRDPKRLEIYTRIMDLAVRKMNQPGVAWEAFRMGLAGISNRRDLMALTDHYKLLVDYRKEQT
jgi:hypothetical protein